jgi:hypothetical protein
MIDMRATYSPEDNKLRMYPSAKLDAEQYAKFKDAGFKWAPRQKLFVAPMWTPKREDLLTSLCGDIQDEDTSLFERSSERAERFEQYSENRSNDSDVAHRNAMESIKYIVPGQPILIGHHSERRHRRDLERHDNAMRKSIKTMQQAEYWQRRAEAALRDAKYKERPDVRARRIKKIEAEQRKNARNIEHTKKVLAAWQASGENITKESAKQILTEIDIHHSITVWMELRDDKIDPKILREKTIKSCNRYITHYERWDQHYSNRLIYEKAMLAEQGASELIEKKKRPAQLPLLNYDAETVTTKSPYLKFEPDTFRVAHMTKKEYASISADDKGTRNSIDGTHRVRIAHLRSNGKSAYGREIVVVFLTDQKSHKKPN